VNAEERLYVRASLRDMQLNQGGPGGCVRALSELVCQLRDRRSFKKRRDRRVVARLFFDPRN
jgi:hypothetical protein